MKSGARYIVTTRWGTFSLDEGAYQDYLAGNLWICWEPGKPVHQKQKVNGSIPVNVSDRAITLRDQAEKIGILATLHRLDIHDALVPYSSRLADISIDEMNLTVRSSNGLRRANIHTLRQLKETMEIENGLSNIRNIGFKSIKEIKQQFFETCYEKLLPYEKAQYWQNIIESKCGITIE